MTIDEFATKVKNALKDEGEEREIRISKVLKNNGICLTGISIPDDEHDMTPTVYLDDFLYEYEEGTPFADVFRQIKRMTEYRDESISFDLKAFIAFGTAKERIVYKLINAGMNRELLKEVPHEMYLDMAMVFYYVLSDCGEKQASILIYNGHMEGWGVDEPTLAAYARKNTPVLLPGKISDMKELIMNLLPEEAIGPAVLREENELMYVLTNERKYFGAACMMYENMLQDIADRLDADIYILPSSVHEVIIIRDTGEDDIAALISMVCEVNDSQVAAEEILSYSVYRYERKSAQIAVFNRENTLSAACC